MTQLLQTVHTDLPHSVIVILSLLLFLSLMLIIVSLRLRDARRDSRRDKAQLHQLQIDNQKLAEESAAANIRVAKLITLLNNEKKNSQEKLDILEEAKEKLRLQFQTLAQQIFDEKSEKFGNENKERVAALLQPLQEQLQNFQKRIDVVQADDIRERTSLRQEIVHLRELNQQINKEAVNLTRALKGDKKMQGNWGELVLERVLEKSGLRQGHEYSVQTGFRDRDNHLLKPDVVIHLPGSKDIIIDSKVSLSAWERYVSCRNDREKPPHLKEHISNLRNHINGLSSKNYPEIAGLQTLDFVLLFIPIDSSYIAAYEADQKLFSDAYDKRVIIVTPTTLLATLKTIENLWRFEHQNRNAKDIADRAAAIYDKLCSFVDDMEKIGKQLATCTATYETALNKLARGRGNIISQAGRLSRLGVKTKKKLPRSIEMMSEDDILN